MVCPSLWRVNSALVDIATVVAAAVANVGELIEDCRSNREDGLQSNLAAYRHLLLPERKAIHPNQDKCRQVPCGAIEKLEQNLITYSTKYKYLLSQEALLEM